MKNGETRRAPFSLSRMDVSAMPDRPPMPEPMRTPVRSCFSGVSSFQAGIRDRLIGSRHRVDDEVVDLALLFLLHPVVGIELSLGRGAARYEIRDLAGEVGSVEFFDAPCAAFAGQQIAPGRFHADTDRCDEAKSRNDDAPHAAQSSFPR